MASPELTAALREQADSVELGDAVADRAAQRAADEAEALAGKAGKAEGPAAERLQELFKELGSAVQAEDEERPVGEAVARSAAAQNLPTAEQALRDLADRMRTLAEQQQTQEELERLAQSLREAGSRVANAGAQNTESTEAMTAAENGQQPSPSGESPPVEGLDAGSMSQEAKPQESDSQSLAVAPPSGQQEGSGGDGRQSQLQAGQTGPQLSLGQPDPNAGRGSEGTEEKEGPRLFAPVPGQPTSEPPTMMLAMPAAPSGGAALNAPGAGLAPGKGSTQAFAGEQTDVAETARQVQVKAQQSGEGSSMLRQIEGGAPREEDASQTASQLSVEFLEAQEAALDEAALPAGRREQVRRYFNALRKRLEAGPQK